METCRHEITTYNGNYSVQSGLHKSTHLCGKPAFKPSICLRHYKIRLHKLIQSLYSQAATIRSKHRDRLQQADSIDAERETMQERLNAL